MVLGINKNIVFFVALLMISNNLSAQKEIKHNHKQTANRSVAAKKDVFKRKWNAKLSFGMSRGSLKDLGLSLAVGMDIIKDLSFNIKYNGSKFNSKDSNIFELGKRAEFSLTQKVFGNKTLASSASIWVPLDFSKDSALDKFALTFPTVFMLGNGFTLSSFYQLFTFSWGEHKHEKEETEHKSTPVTFTLPLAVAYKINDQVSVEASTQIFHIHSNSGVEQIIWQAPPLLVEASWSVNDRLSLTANAGAFNLVKAKDTFAAGIGIKISGILS